MNHNMKKTASFVICILLVFITAASLFYIIKEENHNCTGEDCPVCACIHQAEQTLRNLGTGNIGNAVVSTLPVWNGILLPVCLFSIHNISCKSEGKIERLNKAYITRRVQDG